MAMPLNLPDAHGMRALHFQLLARRDALLERLRERMRGVRHPNDDAPPSDTETASEALLEADLAVKLAELDLEASEMEAVNDALTRMETGNYGNCTDCGAPIGQQRLVALPTALHCITCEARREEAARKPG
jgi:DnaK suppressor protein